MLYDGRFHRGGEEVQEMVELFLLQQRVLVGYEILSNLFLQLLGHIQVLKRSIGLGKL